ncbi:MAG: hypothetical protein AAGH67_15370 [Cyanobacteria bacterium P01_H01_bin.162]
MRHRSTLFSSLISLCLLLGLATGTPAMSPHNSPPTADFQQMEQPLWLKALVTGGGLGLIGLELWWFVFSQPRANR